MAKRNKRNYGMKKMEPAELTITTNTPTVQAGEVGSFTLDLSQCASLINRRFYRQGITWAVAGFKVLTGTGIQGQVTVRKLPTTWVMNNAWQKAFRLWNKQQMDAVEESGSESAVARFRDFKIFADVTHVTADVSNNLLPLDGQLPVAQTYAAGEWEPSQIVLPNYSGQNPTERYLHAVGINVNGVASRGIIEGYADSRAFPQSPDPVTPVINDAQNWMAYMFDKGNDISPLLENATDVNDDLPYPQVNYPGGETQAPALAIHDIVGLSATTVGGISRMKGGTFPCGLIRFDFANTSSTTANIAIQIDLVPGTHRGYMCESMLE